ncbi:MAG: UDP-N-acetylmuramoyl-L-alanyl-D-glutamate--2,6-diaminopimelate ligase [Pseudohongiellaceae bacterium]
MNTAEKLSNKASLRKLLTGLSELSDIPDRVLATEVNGVQMDSRLVTHGDLFLACFGSNHDARDYVEDTVSRGASAVLVESGGSWQGLRMLGDVPVIAVDSLASRISEIASRFFGDPSAALSVFGITGTNGKTSCSQFIAQVLTAMDFRCGTMGTLGYGIYGELRETDLTTPDAVFTQTALAEMAQNNIDPVVMEVSSVGLHQHRVAAVHFDTAIFTNITRDHLDYHGSMEEYASNKRKLFTAEGLRCAVINLDDPWALSILNNIDSGVEILTFSASNPVATVHVEQVEMTPDGFSATINTPFGPGKISPRLLGQFNISNVLAVATALIGYLPRKRDLSMEALCAELSRLRPVSGRMEILGEGGDITAVVDYAHTPDALRSALTALRQHFDGRVWCLFGCGGNRDKGKRPLMGEIAEELADHLIIADDNPRREQGDEIVQHILSGIGNPDAVKVIRDRAVAIDFAIANAGPKDVVLVAGKGHENYQDIAGEKHLFSDANQVRLALRKRKDGKRSERA